MEDSPNYGPSYPGGPPLNVTLAAVLGAGNREAGSNTPDFVLGEFLVDVLAALDKAVNRRDAWYGIAPTPGRPSARAATPQEIPAGTGFYGSAPPTTAIERLRNDTLAILEIHAKRQAEYEQAREEGDRRLRDLERDRRAADNVLVSAVTRLSDRLDRHEKRLLELESARVATYEYQTKIETNFVATNVLMTKSIDQVSDRVKRLTQEHQHLYDTVFRRLTPAEAALHMAAAGDQGPQT